MKIFSVVAMLRVNNLYKSSVHNIFKLFTVGNIARWMGDNGHTLHSQDDPYLFNWKQPNDTS